MPRLALLSVLASALAGCDPAPQTLSLSGQTMGTTYTITALDKSGDLDPEAVQAAIEATLAAVNTTASNWDPTSEVSRFNALDTTEAVAISAEFAAVIEAANQVHAQSLGQFDLTLGPLIELWGFGSRTPETPVPSDEAIAAALARVGQAEVLTLTNTDPPTLQKADPETSVFLAAIAKGYGVDRLGQTLTALGIEDFMVEIGGDLLVAGQNPEGAPWRIGIERPQEGTRAVEEVVRVSDLGMATSGDYRNYVEAEGVRYTHILDAETGRPIVHTTASVTVLAESAMLADAWATALLALGAERGLAVAEQHDLGVLFIKRVEGGETPRFETVASPRFSALQASE
ncbi:MAG: FAD:protein FMN transferase [Pseudomonadota bacterium]